MNGVRNSTKCLTLLSEILLAQDGNAGSSIFSLSDVRDNSEEQMSRTAAGQCAEAFAELHAFAASHHVVMRAFPRLQQMMSWEGEPQGAEWAAKAVEKERNRIQEALSFLDPICRALEAGGNVIVIKSLDHWPDLGSDLDLFTDAHATDVVDIMRKHFKAELAERSWGDRLANKWNFAVPGLPELVEVHVGRLGQTGEQIATAKSLVDRARSVQIGTHKFRVPAPEERLVISTLQRMYRHFYIRLCDILDNVQLVENGAIDYGRLRSLARAAGLWEGLATYLVIISDYAESYRGKGLPLPALVTSEARFGGEEVYFRRNFIRIPLLPHGAGLYASELRRLLLNGEIRNTLRLSLLPGLATAAAVELKLTGSDKGIW
jgi:Uncharacterised nucleotidyltransferase